MKNKDKKEFEKDTMAGIRNASFVLIGLGIVLLPFARFGVLLMFALLALVLGGGGWWYYIQDRKHKSVADFENLVLVTAGRNRGVLTPTILALEAHISVEEAIKRLDQLVSLGVCRIETSPAGQVEYVFPDFLDTSRERS